MLYIIIFFLLVSVYLYCLLGGADFGAGILELTVKKKNKEKVRKLVTNAIAPIWEANHMWLIITVVILFNAFPPIYSRVSISLYIPLILLLVGIVLRGCAFTFRHYDALKDYSQEVYSRIFNYSSLFVSFFFGLVIGAVVSDKIIVNPLSFADTYLFPWLNLFSISTGIFICALFVFTSAVYLIADIDDQEFLKDFIPVTKKINIVTVLSGGLVFVMSLIDNNGFAERFLQSYLSIILLVLATVLLPVIWKYLSTSKTWLLRFLAGAQLLFILGAFYAAYYPSIILIKDAEDLTLFNTPAPEVTLAYLGWALIFGSLLIFPSLFYLIKVFKMQRQKE